MSEPSEQALPESSSHKKPGSTTMALALGAQRLDRESCAALFERLSPAIHTWATLRLPRGAWRPIEPEEVVQEVWVRALDRIQTFDPQKGSFRMWMFGIAGRSMLDLLRKASRTRAVGESKDGSQAMQDVPAHCTTASRRLVRDESLGRVIDKLLLLSSDEKRLLIYRGLEGLPHEVVAERMGLSPEAAGKRWQRLRDRLAAEDLPGDLLEN